MAMTIASKKKKVKKWRKKKYAAQIHFQTVRLLVWTRISQEILIPIIIAMMNSFPYRSIRTSNYTVKFVTSFGEFVLVYF